MRFPLRGLSRPSVAFQACPCKSMRSPGRGQAVQGAGFSGSGSEVRRLFDVLYYVCYRSRSLFVLLTGRSCGTLVSKGTPLEDAKRTQKPPAQPNNSIAPVRPLPALVAECRGRAGSGETRQIVRL